ncbi:unnamed protein product [Diplocarpon coronariae]
MLYRLPTSNLVAQAASEPPHPKRVMLMTLQNLQSAIPTKHPRHDQESKFQPSPSCARSLTAHPSSSSACTARSKVNKHANRAGDQPRTCLPTLTMRPTRCWIPILHAREGGCAWADGLGEEHAGLHGRAALFLSPPRCPSPSLSLPATGPRPDTHAATTARLQASASAHANDNPAQVEGEAQGPEADLALFLADLETGPRHAQVARLEREDREALRPEDGFEIRR